MGMKLRNIDSTMAKKYLTILLFFIEILAYGQQVSEKKKLITKTDSIKTLLQGAWFGQEYDEHAVFYVKGDTISYIEHFDRYKYSISKDSIDIITNPNTFRVDFIIKKLTKDSLIMDDMRFAEVERKTYWRTH